jgi:hypothetical protein
MARFQYNHLILLTDAKKIVAKHIIHVTTGISMIFNDTPSLLQDETFWHHHVLGDADKLHLTPIKCVATAIKSGLPHRHGQGLGSPMGWVGFGIETDRISVSVTVPKLA